MKPARKSYRKETVALFWQHAWRYRGKLAVFLVGSIVVIATDIIQPFLNRNMLDAALTRTPMYGHSANWYVWASFWVAILHSATWRTMGMVNCYFQPRVMSDLYNTCFRYMLGHSFNFFADHQVGSITGSMKRLPGAFETIDDRLKWNVNISVGTAIFGIMFIYWRLGRIGDLFLAWFVIYIGFSCLAAKLKYKPDLATSDQDSQVSGRAADVYGNITTVQLNNAQAYEAEQFESRTEELYKRRNRSWLLGECIQIIQGVSILILNVSVFRWAVRACEAGTYTAGDVTMLIMYQWQLSQNLWELGNHIKAVFEALATGSEMVALLKQPHEVVDAVDAAPLQITEGRITFEHVTFGYEPDKPVLKDFCLEIEPGQRVAIVGLSGAGKTTLVQLLLRFFNLTQGRILIDGQDIRKATLASVRAAISYVLQSPPLFHRSLLENVRYGNLGAAFKQVFEAARLAHAHEFIWRCKRRYATLVGERGIKLSGGQRQRVAIAMAILKDALIVVFDEATSALDSEFEALIQDAMHNLMRGRTWIVIAHRLSTIKESDKIVVLSQGQIAEMGTHEELLQIPEGIYRGLWEKQAGGFVPAGSPTE